MIRSPLNCNGRCAFGGDESLCTSLLIGNPNSVPDQMAILDVAAPKPLPMQTLHDIRKKRYSIEGETTACLEVTHNFSHHRAARGLDTLAHALRGIQ